MVCPRCGSAISAAAVRCSHCAAPLGQAVATGVLTPPPAANEADAPTSFEPPSGDASTSFGPPSGDAPTSFGPPSGDAPTSFGPPSGDAPTSLVAPARNAPTSLVARSRRPASADETGLDLVTRVLAARDAKADEPITIAPGVSGGAALGSLLSPGQAFASRYHIIRPLGIGGMGAVYQAWDDELGVAVAIKVIRPDVMADPATAAEVERRFKRELLLARQVTHKNVVRIHDLGEREGIKYITMSYVDGADLATLLKREGTLLVPTVLRIARAVVSGLVEAHKAGVVHRDLKPANIMLDKTGDALIMDFGIARSAGGPRAADQVNISLPAGVRHTTSVAAEATRYGAVMGTVEYMAPEQARGQDVDQRADIYALGLMLYDMLVGRQRRAESTKSAIEELKARMAQPPPPPKSILPDIPEAVDRLISRCIEPDPANRYPTTEELAAELDRLDENGIPIPELRRFTPRMIAAAVVLVASLVTGTWWLTRTPPPPKQHDPVSVLIADFQNQTGDPTFDRSIESVLKLALEGAGFITAYDRTGVRNLGAAAVEKLDDTTAQQIAVKQGVGIVISGALKREGDNYGISVKATQAVTGNVIASATNRAPSKDKVLAAATMLATTVRTALGDETSKSDAQIFAMDTLSATNLDVVRQYAVATESMARARFEEALQSFAKAVAVDPNFGMAYQGMALASRNLDRQEDAEKYIKEALRHVDRMTERERFRARGFFYRVTGDYAACVKEYGDLVARYAADVAAHNQIALCSTLLRNMPKAVEEMRQVVTIVPKSTILRNNLALYLSYSGDFPGGEREARAIQNPVVNSIIALAFAQLGQGQVPQALDTYKRLAVIDSQGASRAVSGAGDVAIYEGRFADAVRILGDGAAADMAAKEPNRAAGKFAGIAYAHLLRRQNGPAIAAADNALKNSRTVKIRFLAGRVLAEAGEIAKARTVATGLTSELTPESQAHGKIIEGLIALKRKDVSQAIQTLTEANTQLDTWIGRFDLGRAYLEAGQFIKADSEFDRCIKRRGETLSLFLEEEPTFGYLPSVYYYQGRVREGLNSAGFGESYREYLKIRGISSDDPLLPEVRRRVGG
jgi:serine/threonine protein kinase/tetratricopeptide (TPR) repeat protein